MKRDGERCNIVPYIAPPLKRRTLGALLGELVPVLLCLVIVVRDDHIQNVGAAFLDEVFEERLEVDVAVDRGAARLYCGGERLV